ncbi:nitrogenase-stabilizing/protective protein NifW [Marichromatium gracile]|uniref:nitrogenase-stabilizing/protective protein NifW n=1 Tax=Marichromatium TaxID=85076 RepID=UPI000F3FEB8E|nr:MULTISPECIES: nitrogenase-stabilizing/protective protein NifW [Marichromatium]MCF1184509.1 nitrogenase-stabilizing/protective protein NifW [Marichromatium gracile]RNE90611.1 nitrogen fixation protein NifW [Marichromatium sp. AB31]
MNDDSDLHDLVSAEDFLEHFEIDYDPAVVRVNRLHILQRFHDYLADAEPLPEQAEARHRRRAELLTRAYHDFVASDARTERVFRVFHLHGPRSGVRVDLQLDPAGGDHAPQL